MKCQHCHRLVEVEETKHCPICLVGLCPSCYDKHMAYVFPLGKPAKKLKEAAGGPTPRAFATR